MRKPSPSRIKELTGYKTCGICKETKTIDVFKKYPEGSRELHRTQYYNYCRTCVNAQVLGYYYAKQEDKKKYQREYARKNRSKIKEQSSYRNRSSLYERRVRKARPIWLSKEQRAEMLSLYKECNMLNSSGIKYNIDHIVPINSRYVCGLHVSWNLQIISAEANNRKTNSICNNTLSKLYVGYSNFEITKDLLFCFEN